MDKQLITHKCSEEDYGYVSGLLKARELQFIIPSEIDSFFALRDTNEICDRLPEQRYKYKFKGVKDSLEFEDLIFKRYLEEIKEIEKYLPEQYLLHFFSSIHSVIYKFDFSKLDEGPLPAFESNLKMLIKIAENGTEYSKVISSYIVDRFNILEGIRAYLNEEDCKIYYKGGNISNKSLRLIFSSNFSQIPLEVESTLWSDFLHKNLLKGKIDFEFIFNFESYWLSILYKLGEMKKNEPYGLDYVISYFLRFLFEILNLNKAYLYTQYDVIVGNREYI